MSMALVERESTRTRSASGPRELGEKMVTKLWVRYWEFWNMFIGSRVGDRFVRTTAGTDN